MKESNSNWFSLTGTAGEPNRRNSVTLDLPEWGESEIDRPQKGRKTGVGTPLPGADNPLGVVLVQLKQPPAAREQFERAFALGDNSPDTKAKILHALDAAS